MLLVSRSEAQKKHHAQCCREEIFHAIFCINIWRSFDMLTPRCDNIQEGLSWQDQDLITTSVWPPLGQLLDLGSCYVSHHTLLIPALQSWYSLYNIRGTLSSRKTCGFQQSQRYNKWHRKNLDPSETRDWMLHFIYQHLWFRHLLLLPFYIHLIAI